MSGGRFDLPWGSDEALLAALATGARGAVGSTYNWAPALYADLLKAFARGDLVDAFASRGFMGAAKGVMCRLGVPVGRARSPVANPSADQVDDLMRTLDALGFGSWGAHPPGFV